MSVKLNGTLLGSFSQGAPLRLTVNLAPFIVRERWGVYPSPG